MNAVALLARAREAGVDVRVDQGDILLRGQPDAALVQSMREAKPALVRLLTGRDCYRCGAAREPLEIGGWDLFGWRCDGCLEAAGLLPLGRAPLIGEMVIDDELLAEEANHREAAHD